MKLLGFNGQAFIPMLEYYFQAQIEVERELPILSIYREIQTRRFSKCNANLIIEVGLSDKHIYLSTELQSKITSDYLLITEVSDVLSIIRRDVDLGEKVVILTTLRTHVEELRKFTNNLCIHIPFENKELSELRDPKEFPNRVLINCKSTILDHSHLLNCKALIKFKDNCFTPSDSNYANEYDEIHHIARILKVPVYTAVTKSELNYLKTSLHE